MHNLCIYGTSVWKGQIGEERNIENLKLAICNSTIGLTEAVWDTKIECNLNLHDWNSCHLFYKIDWNLVVLLHCITTFVILFVSNFRQKSSRKLLIEKVVFIFLTKCWKESFTSLRSWSNWNFFRSTISKVSPLLSCKIMQEHIIFFSTFNFIRRNRLYLRAMVYNYM